VSLGINGQDRLSILQQNGRRMPEVLPRLTVDHDDEAVAQAVQVDPGDLLGADAGNGEGENREQPGSPRNA